MIGAVLFLPASLLAAQITISEVSAEREGGRVAITVKGDAMIDPEATSAKVGEGRLYLFVYDARVHEANRSWKNGVSDDAEEIRAHRHKQKVELAVPLGDSACQGPVEIQKAPGGLRALVGCEGEPRPTLSRAARAAAARAEIKAVAKSDSNPDAKLETKVPRVESKTGDKLVAKAEPRPAAIAAREDEARAEPQAAPARLSEREALALRATLSLDPIAPAPPPAATRADRPASAPAAAKPATRSPSTPAPASAGVASPLLPVAERAPATESQDKPTRANDAPGSGGGVILGGCALLALAGAAFFFSRRRAATSRHIQILETASLGPKRALVVARIGDSTMILGSSEAGITLLQSLPDGDAPRARGGAALEFGISVPPFTPVAAPPPPVLVGAAPAFTSVPAPQAFGTLPGASAARIEVVEPNAAPVPAPAGWALDALGVPVAEENSDDDTDAGFDEPRPIGQAGLLARLFRRGRPANDPPAPRFEDLLEDSFEDQELRRKLALGLPGRVR